MIKLVLTQSKQVTKAITLFRISTVPLGESFHSPCLLTMKHAHQMMNETYFVCPVMKWEDGQPSKDHNTIQSHAYWQLTQ